MTDQPERIVFNIDNFKNCPICGTKIDASIKGGLYKSGWVSTSDSAEIQLFCPKCGIKSIPFDFTQEGIKSAITAWNSRVEPIGNSEELPEWMRKAIETEIEIQLSECGLKAEALYWVLSLKKPEEE
ncbi:MAG: hypothetical protein PHS80_00365 [Methanothrix sp.]|nr:hypothetical protein [Bacteroidales bacterium]MDD2753954.1 hypothetical protein [Methanothrix sp.]